MTLTDSVSIFAEGTPEEQVQELVHYIVRGRSDEERAAIVHPFVEIVEIKEGQKPFNEDDDRRRQVFSKIISELKSLGEGTEREIEGFFNMIYAHLLSLYALDSSEIREHVNTLLQIISSAPSDKASIKYRILSNLFNAIPRFSSLRLPVYVTILDLASVNGEIEVLKLSRADVERWLSEWDISEAEKAAFAKRIADAYARSNQRDKSYEYSLTYVRLLPTPSPEAQTAAVDVIASALRLPSVFDFDPLLKLDAVVATKDHELFSLLKIFLNDGLVEFQSWDENHPGAIENHHLDKPQLARKMRLLTLASLGFRYVGQDLPYSKIQEALQIDVSEVDKWVIDVIRAGLLWGKLSQTNQTLHVVRSTARTFEKEQWEILEKRVLAWKTGLSGVLEVVANAKRQAGLVPAPVA
ncbi:hypothetical protein AX17_002145 [Amanita inopinata Kibby_2008]|nr:hypothetical protein AX17_002145 [Amanita inopinata Kibby_2008]